jgi:hypothetical protein
MMWWRRSAHLGGVMLLVVSLLAGVVMWILVQAQRADPLPTLVWASGLSDQQMMAASPVVLDRLGGGWWWVYATPIDRQRLRSAGAELAIALPTPLAQMAGCSVPAARF